MHILLNSLILFLIVTTAYAQQNSATTTSSPKCELQELAILAALGDTAAEYNLAVEFFSGRDLPRDYAKAAILWKKASDGGHIGAHNNLGYLKYYGRGIAQDYAKGIRLWRFAAERGWAESQVHLGQAYSDGRFLESDYIEAYAWAKAGKHYAPRMADTLDRQIAEAVANDADKVLEDMRKRLSAEAMKEAEAKAADYIRRFGPR